MWAFLLVLSIGFFGAGGVFYSAALSRGHGSNFADDVCAVGDAFCTHPDWLIVAGGIALFFALFLRVFTMIRGCDRATASDRSKPQ